MGVKGLSVYVEYQQFLFLGEVWRLSYREEKSARKKFMSAGRAEILELSASPPEVSTACYHRFCFL